MSAESIKSINYQEKTYPIAAEIEKRNEFSEREVGLTHPDVSSFLRLNDSGDIEIFAAPGVGIIISAKARSISLFGDSVKMFTKEDGLRWNSYKFNYSASTYVEPTLVKINPKFVHTAQNNVDHYLTSIDQYEQEETQKPITILGDYGYTVQETVLEQKNISEYFVDNLNEEQIKLIEIYKSSLSSDQLKYMIDLLKKGTDFESAYKLAIRNINE